MLFYIIIGIVGVICGLLGGMLVGSERKGGVLLSLVGIIILAYASHGIRKYTEVEKEEEQVKVQEILEEEFKESIDILESSGEGKYRIKSQDKVYEVYYDEERQVIKAVIEEGKVITDIGNTK